MSTKRSIEEYESIPPSASFTSTPINGHHHHSGGSFAKCNTKANSKANLDDFIYELEQRNEEMCNGENGGGGKNAFDGLYLNDGHQSGSGGGGGVVNLNHSSLNDQANASTTASLMAQLAKKEKDLILAAELGKALLDRNEELSRANELINEEYTRNLEIMEQEKYALKKKLNSIEIEYENKIQELQADLQAVREKLNVHFEINRENDTENSRLIEELTRQNQRLTEELKITSNRESLLEKEIQSLKEQFHARRTNFTDHIGQLEGLRDEINLLSKRKIELEGKISSLNEEKECISISLDESQFRIVSLEKLAHDNEMVIQSQQKDLDELRRMNTHYQNKIDNLLKAHSFETYKMQGSSLYNEIEMSSHSSDDNHQSSPNYFSEEDIEFSSPDNCSKCAKHKQQMMDLYTKLKSLCDDLYKRRLNDSGNSPMNVSSNSNHDSGIQTGTLSCIDEINYLLCDIQELIKSEFMQCITCQEFNKERAELEHIRKENQQHKEEIQKLSNEMIQLTSKFTIAEVESSALKEENAILKEDITSLNTDSKDEIVNRTLKLRDETIAKKNSVEIELAKVRIELMHVNSQLLETIQQKVELSQQLEQWQVDMEILIEDQLKSKLSAQEKCTNGSSTMAPAAAPVSSFKKENLFGRIRFPKLLNYQS